MANWSHCVFFRPLATNPDVCAKWIRPLKGGAPFCAADIEPCETRGLRLMPRPDQEDDGWQDGVDLGVGE